MLNKFINGYIIMSTTEYIIILLYYWYHEVTILFTRVSKEPYTRVHPTNMCAYDCVSLGKVNDCDSWEEGILDPSKKLFRIGSSTSDDVINHRWTDCLDLEATSRIDQRKSKKCTHPPISPHACAICDNECRSVRVDKCRMEPFFASHKILFNQFQRNVSSSNTLF